MADKETRVCILDSSDSDSLEDCINGFINDFLPSESFELIDIKYISYSVNNIFYLSAMIIYKIDNEIIK